MRIPFGPYEPDKPPFLASGLQIASNVYKSAIGYRPVGQFVAISDALPASPLGATTFTSPSGGTLIIAAASSSVYLYQTGTWALMQSGFSVANRWRFAQFGGIGIAVNGVDPPQKINLSNNVFSSLGGSPPVLAMLTVVKDFLVGGIVNGITNMVQWSGINDAESWTIGLNQSDYQILPSGGDVTGLIGGEFGLILQRNRVSRMTYVGDNLVFQFDEISSSIGCVSPHSVAQAGQIAFWLSDGGFIMWDGATLKPIGQERVNRTFFASYSNASWAAMSTAIDVKNGLVAWSMGDRVFVYNWVLDSWSIIDQASAVIFSGFSGSGDPLFYSFNASNELGSFAGTPMEATLGTGDLELASGRESRISSVRPLTDAVDGVSLRFICRDRLGEDVDESIYDAMEDSGDIATRESGRYARITQTIAAGTAWTYSEGIDPTVTRGARR